MADDGWDFEDQQKWAPTAESLGITGWEARLVMVIDENGVNELLRVVLYDNNDVALPAMFWYPESMRLFASTMLDGLNKVDNETG